MHLSCQNAIHYLNSKLLQAPNVDGSFLGGKEVAAPHTELLRGAHHPTQPISLTKLSDRMALAAP